MSIQVYASSEARAQFRDVLDLAAAGTDVIVTRHGKPIVVIVNYDDYMALQDSLDNPRTDERKTNVNSRRTKSYQKNAA